MAARSTVKRWRLGSWFRAATLALIAAPLSAACAGSGDFSEAPSDDRRLGITSGLPTLDYEYVVKLLDTNTGRVRCSASLISDRVLLTAAHCLVGDVTSLCARLETAGDASDVAIQEQRVHPEFAVLEPMAASFANDIALLRLAVPVSVSPIGVELSLPVAVAETVRVVGYGRTAADRHDEGTRRVGESKVALLGANTFELQGGSSPCIFDSGGLVQAAESGNQIGVISSGDAACAHHAEIARLDTARAFITTFLDESSRVEQHDELACAWSSGSDAALAGREGSCSTASARGCSRSTKSFACGLALISVLRRRRARRRAAKARSEGWLAPTSARDA